MAPLRLAALALAGVMVVAGVWFWLDRDADGAEVVGASSRSGWMTIRFEGVRVDIPASWERVDRDDCEFDFETWAPSGASGCRWTGGVAVYRSATFDPAHEAGVRRAESPGEPTWNGYIYAGDFAVYASDDDRETVVHVLRSAN